MSVHTISPEELQQLKQQGKPIDLIDVRTPMEYADVHVVGARSVPLDTLDPQAFAKVPQADPLYVICRSGSRAAQACQKLHSVGVDNVCNVEGGTLAWERAGLPVVRGPKTMSLERQVRIAAGSLVVLGVSLGWLIHPVFLGLSAFVGGGLVFSGLTDTCGMGLLLARMPWNRIEERESSCPS